jgi:hypothetical protein
MIPNELDEWTYELIKKIVEDGVFETDKFDLKEELPHKNDIKSKERLEKSVCAFANTEGGFLIFGIKDDKSLSYENRIIGISPARDFPREFGDMIINIEPHIYYSFKNPAIKIPISKNVIHVVKIPQSPERPHITSKGEFYYRTNRGNMQMSYQQIKESFLNEEQRRQKLRLLFIELLSNKEQATSMITPDDRIMKSYSLVTLDSSVLQTLLVDTYPIIIQEDELISLLMRIRAEIKVINNEMRIFYATISLPITNSEEIVRKHNDSVNTRIKELIPLLDESLKILQDKFGLVNPFNKPL